VSFVLKTTAKILTVIYVLAGAILFALSDSAIAINKFTWDFDYSGPITMSTYLAGQCLIVTGYIKEKINYD